MPLTRAVLAEATFARGWRHGPEPLVFATWPALCGLFLAPLLTMICRSTLAGMILSGSLAALTWLVTLAMAWLWFGIDLSDAQVPIIGRLTLAMAVSSPLLGFLGWRRFAELEATDSASPALHLPRLLTPARGARVHSPLRALAAKEVHLQQLTFVIAGLYVISWAVMVLLQHYIAAMATFPIGGLMLLYCMGLAITIGAVASAEERHNGALGWQLLQPTPAWQQWMVKLGVTFGLACLCAVGLPLLLIGFTPHDTSRVIRVAGDLAVFVVLLTAGSVYLSSLCTSAVRVMVLFVPAAMALSYFVRTVSAALHWVTLKLAGPLMAGIVTGSIAPASVQPTSIVVLVARASCVTLLPLLLWLGFLNHTSSERDTRRVVRQVAALALFIVIEIVAVGGLLASYELRAR